MNKLRELAQNDITLMELFVPAASTKLGDFNSDCNLHEAAMEGDLDKLFPKFVKELETNQASHHEQQVYWGEFFADMPVNILIGRFATPVKKYHANRAVTCSWGYYHNEWIMAENLEALCDKALAWAADLEAKAKAGAEE